MPVPRIGVFAREGRHFVAVAASRHRAPSAAMRTRSIVEEKTASRIGAQANAGFCPFDDYLRGGTRDGSKQPVQTVFARDILDPPGLVFLHQFVVTLGDAEYAVDRLDPLPGDSFFPDHRRKHAMQRFPESLRFLQKAIRRLRVALRQDEEASTSLGGDDA